MIDRGSRLESSKTFAAVDDFWLILRCLPLTVTARARLLTQKKDIHTHPHTTCGQRFLLPSVMSYDDSAHWHSRAKEMLARAEQMDECVTKQVLRRAADAYERLARTAEQRAKRSPPNPVSPAVVLPAE